MVTRGLFPRLGLDHCVRSELSPELEQGLEADAVQGPRTNCTSWLTLLHTPPYPTHTLGTEIHAKNARYWLLALPILQVEADLTPHSLAPHAGHHTLPLILQARS